MRVLLVSAATAALFVAGHAYAAESTAGTSTTATTAAASNHTASGTITAFSMKNHTLTLKGGKVYVLPADFTDPGLKKGEKVQVTYSIVKGKRDASAVTVAM